MSQPETKDLSVVAEGAPLERKQTDELAETVSAIARRHHEVVQAAQMFDLSDEELAGLPPRTRTVAQMARSNRNEVPYGIIMAHDFVIAREKRKMQEGERVVHIHAQDGANVGVFLPTRPPPPDDADVAVIDADRLKPPEDREG